MPHETGIRVPKKLLCRVIVVTIGLASILASTNGLVAQDEPDKDEIEKKIAQLQTELAQLSEDDSAGYTKAADRMLWYYKHLEMKDRSVFKDLPWQFIGPNNISGRVTDVAIPVPRGKNYSMYVATASGGVWKTSNEGTSWEPIFEHGPSTSVGDVTIAPSNQDIVWIGLGEANIFRSSMAGCGVYQSTDRGQTWQHKGLGDTHTIARILIHPEDPNTLYVAASGHEWTNNPDRGVYKSTDGGETWQKVLFIDDKTGAIDLVMDPTDPETLYASTWQRIRKRWNDPRNEPDYSGSGIHKSTDGGKTWTAINEGLPPAESRGRIGIDVCQSQPNVLYAFVDNYEIAEIAEEGELNAYGLPKEKTIKGAELYRSNDAGKTWDKVSESNDYMLNLAGTYGWVFGQVRVDPVDPETVYVMGLALNVSNDGGKTFRRLRGMHGDHHALWIDPSNTDYLVNGNDGGVVVSYDAGQTWRQFTDTLPAVQFFNVGYDMDVPFHVYGSVQDHGSFRGTVDISRGRDELRPTEWSRAPGGEGSTHAVDPTDPTKVYSAGFYGRISRTNIATNDSVRLLPEQPEDEPRRRGQWIAPFVLSPHNPRILYHGMNWVYRSLNQGEEMHRISDDLTYNDPEKMGDIPYQTISSLAESPVRFGLLYAGTDDGRVHLTKNSGDNWNEITKGLEPHRWISRIEPSRYDEATVYLAQNGKRWDDFRPLLWKSTDYGKTWQSIVNNIPSGPINVVREDPKNKDILYVGTDLGVYVSLDGGSNWQVLANGLPTTFVHDLIIHPRDDMIVIATHGRGMYAMDAQPIQGYGKPQRASAPARQERRPARDEDSEEDEEENERN